MLRKNDPDDLAKLCWEVINAEAPWWDSNRDARSGGSVLVFCSSRNGCCSAARNIVQGFDLIQKACKGQIDDSETEIQQKRKDLLDKLKKSPHGLSPDLEQCV